MGFIRARLAGFSMLMVGIHLAACGLATSAAYCALDAHHGAVSSEECHMPAETDACPMHHASAPKPSGPSTPAQSLPVSPSLRCNCGASFSLDALLGTPFVLNSTTRAVGATSLISAIAIFVPATLDEPSQVSSPPPRS